MNCEQCATELSSAGLCSSNHGNMVENQTETVLLTSRGQFEDRWVQYGEVIHIGSKGDFRHADAADGDRRVSSSKT